MPRLLIVANYAKEHINKFHLPFIRRFKELGWQVDVACKVDAEIPYADHVYNLPMERNPFRPQSFSAISQLRKIIKEGKYDVVHVHTMSGKVIGILASRGFQKEGLKTAYTSHGFQYYKGASFVEWLFMPFDKWLVRNIDVLITINEEDYNNAKRFRFKVKQIEKCYGAGINLYRFKATSQNRNNVREEIGIKPEDLVLIYVAELSKNKNQMMLIKVFKRVADRIPNTHLLLVGPDHYNHTIQDIIRKESLGEKIHCLGWRSDIPELITASDIAVASSIREGLGINIVEYMACGVPVIAVDNRGHREIIRDGINGVLIPQNNDKLMAESIIHLVNHPEQGRVLTNNASNELNQFTEDAVVDRLIDIYRKDILPH